MPDRLSQKVLAGDVICREDLSHIAALEGVEIFRLFAEASRLRKRYRGKGVDLCSIINAKSGACSEDCSYCAQSSKSKADIPVFPLVEEGPVVEKAREAKGAGVKRFCIVTSGRKAGKGELRKIASLIQKVRGIGLLPCATLGLLEKDELRMLRESGLERYHHNLETSERFFPAICSTHTYRDKMRTIEAVKSIGLSLCSGGIFGIGESWQDRIDMAFGLRDAGADSIPVNFLIAVKGTEMEDREPLNPFDALKIISLYRFALPEKEIRVCGGRRQTLGEFNSMVFMAGADSLLTGNYLTTTGTPYEEDLKLIRQYGLEAG